MNMQLTAVGTSGSFPGPGNPASSYVLRADPSAAPIVVDMGQGALGDLQTHTDLSTIEAVLLSHLHPDHFIDLTGMYVARSYDPRFFCEGGRPLCALPVYGPAGTEDRLLAAHHTDPGASPVAENAQDANLDRVFEFHDLHDGAHLRVGGLEVEATLVDHPVEAYAMRFTDAAGRVMTYSGDTDYCEGIVAAARGADLFLCEAAFQEGRDTVRGIHLSGRRAGIVAREAGVGKLALTHIPPWTDPEVVAAEAAAEFSGPLEVARPGRRWDI